MADDAQQLAQALRLLQAGDHAGALEIAHGLRGSSSVAARAHMVIGIARREEGRLEESLFALERAASRGPGDYAVAYELGLTFQALGRFGPARSSFARAGALRPGFAPAHRGAAVASIALGDFATAEREYAAASAATPGDADLAQLLAQVQLLRGRLEAGWQSYARRPQRRQYEAQFASQGRRYEAPALATLSGRRAMILAEQGLGDNLFFLRYAPALGAAGVRLEYVGDERLHPLLARTALFEQLHSDRTPLVLGDAVPVLLGDLPQLDAVLARAHPPSLAIAPLDAAVERVRERLGAAGPAPWIGVTWRAGVAPESGGLAKRVPLDALFDALRPTAGTIVSLQRAPLAGEIEQASAALGRPVHDFAWVNADLDDALAVTTLLDRHVAVSNTNIHLAAAAGARAEVLVPFPPEWRWGLEGSSPWFPAVRVHRQGSQGDWSAALRGIGG
ncbi:MAG TPA: tetratricopeptide repeat protein [Usitatibacter sp.]|jgi:tetratricopeptide (TPR) repeat protein|nr:tetratricopeptide repeat protein [Usitatibacter sp.]